MAGTQAPSVDVLLSRLEPWSPFTNCVWPIESPITRDEIERCIADGSWVEGAEPLPNLFPGLFKEPTREVHVKRIAYLVKCPSSAPIGIDVGMPWHANPWPVCDGNHRLAAAFYRHDPTIKAGICGAVSLMEEMLGVY